MSSFCSLARTRRKVEPLQPTSQFASRQTVKSTSAAPAYLVRVKVRVGDRVWVRVRVRVRVRLRIRVGVRVRVRVGVMATRCVITMSNQCALTRILPFSSS